MTKGAAGANDPASGKSEQGHEAPDTSRGGSGRGAPGAPASLLSDLGRLRKQARSARHAYWLPLLLFGLVIGASSPFYLVTQPSQSDPVIWTESGTLAALSGMFDENPAALAIYWLLTIGAGLYITWLWYRRHGRRVGLMTPARGFVIAGVIVGVLVIVLPALLLGAAIFTGTALLASLYNIENILYRLGWSPAIRFSTLPNILLPALVLLISGACAYALQRRRRVAA
jgi:hypothetical protein